MLCLRPFVNAKDWLSGETTALLAWCSKAQASYVGDQDKGRRHITANAI